jgi:hypothetical protein
MAPILGQWTWNTAARSGSGAGRRRSISSPFRQVQCAALESAAGLVSYGWGMIPVCAQIGRTAWTTSLWPKDGQYIVPLKAVVRKAERLEIGDTVAVRLNVGA